MNEKLKYACILPIDTILGAKVEVVGAISGVDVLFLKDSNGLVAGLDIVRRRGIARGSIGRGGRSVGRGSIGRGWGSVDRTGPVGKLRPVGDSNQGQGSNDELKHIDGRKENELNM